MVNDKCLLLFVIGLESGLPPLFKSMYMVVVMLFYNFDMYWILFDIVYKYKLLK